jgi:hypothetical protein
MNQKTISQWWIWAAAGIFSATAGCIKAPNVVVLDHKTALEQQAAGEYIDLEAELLQAGLAHKGEDIARSQLEQQQIDLQDSSLGEIARIYSAVRTDAQWLDSLLVARCIAEGLDGLLQETPERCQQDVDRGELARVIGRANLSRRQIWQVIQKHQPGASLEQVRDTWRGLHLKRVVCGGQIQRAAQNWEQKKC